MKKALRKTKKSIEQKTETPRLYRKKYEALVEDGFDWANPKTSKAARPLLLHGTSKSLLKQIRKEGLRFKCPLLTPEDLAAVKDYFVTDIFNPINSAHLEDAERTISLTLNPSTAIIHAVNGPEILERIISEGRDAEQCITKVFPEKISQILFKIDEFYLKHVPVVLFIDYPPYQPDHAVLKKLKRYWNSNRKPSPKKKVGIEDVMKVTLYSLKREGFSMKEAIQLCYAKYGRGCYTVDIPDDTVIPPENIKAIIEITDALNVKLF